MFVLGDYDTTETVIFPFDTFDSNGASVTISGLAVTDIEVYKGASMTQRASDNGYALLDTDGTDLDGATGVHGFSIDLSDNSDAGFYANGSQYRAVVDAITVDGQTVRFQLLFTIGRSLRPTTAGRKLTVESDGMAHADLREWRGTQPLELAANLTVECNVVTIVNTSPTMDVTNAALKVSVVAIGQTSQSIAAANNLRDFMTSTGYAATNSTVGTVTTVGTVNDLADNAIDTGAIQPGTFDPTHFITGYYDEIADQVLDEATAGHTTAGTLGKAITDVLADTGELQTDWADGGRLDVILDARASQTTAADIQSRLPAALISGRMASDVEALGDDTEAVADLKASAKTIVRATVDTVTNGHTPTTTEFQADDVTEATADHFVGRVVIFTTGALAGQATDITAYALVGGIGQFTVTALTEAPANDDEFVIV